MDYVMTEARLARNRAAAPLATAARQTHAIKRAKLIMSAVEQGIDDRTLAKWLGIQESSVPKIKWAARKRVNSTTPHEAGPN